MVYNPSKITGLHFPALLKKSLLQTLWGKIMKFFRKANLWTPVNYLIWNVVDVCSYQINITLKLVTDNK